jgi:hypothetical protein
MQPTDFPQHTVPHIQTPDEQFRQAMIYHTRRTSVATVFIAWVVGLFALVSIILGIIVGVQLAKIGNVVNPGGDISTCQSLGGTDPSC